MFSQEKKCIYTTQGEILCGERKGEVKEGFSVVTSANLPWNMMTNLSVPGLSLTDVTMELSGKTLMLKDDREAKYFQTGRFSEGAPILDYYLSTNFDGYTRFDPVSNGVKISMNSGREFLSCNNKMGIKTLNGNDPNAVWRVYKSSKGKYYLMSATSRMFMYNAGSGIVKLDIVDSLNVISYGGFAAL